MTTSTAWQLGQEAAERYEEILTPVILGPFAQALVDFARVQPEEHVVDVGCGTGAAARYAADCTTGSVIGVDVNPGMITVATAVSAAAHRSPDWRVADATALPLEDATVDLVLCAQSLQFMREKALPALAEIRRILKPNGRVAISLWCAIEESPYFHLLVKAIDRHIDAETAAGLQSAFALSEAAVVSNLLQNAGFGEIETSVARLDLPLPELTDWVPRHISATPMAASFSQAAPAVQQRVVQNVITELRGYYRNGQVVVPFQSHIMVGRI